MSDLGYLIWFVATAVVIVAVVLVGTLGAAGFFKHEESEGQTPPQTAPERPRDDARYRPTHRHAA